MNTHRTSDLPAPVRDELGAGQGSPLARSRYAAAPLTGRWAFRLALLFLFLRVSYGYETLTFLLGRSNYLLYLVGLPLLFSALADGAIGRALRRRENRYWIFFMIWFVLVIPFSSYRSSSLGVLVAYSKAPLFLLLVFTSFYRGPQGLMKILKTLYWGGVLSLATSMWFGQNESGRFSVEFGLMSNANDMAAHFLFLLPFLFFFTTAPRQSLWMRVIGVPVLGVALYLVIYSGSRGALVALVAEVVVLFMMARWSQRAGVMLAAVLGLVIVLPYIPAETLVRLGTIVPGYETTEDIGRASMEERELLLNESLRITGERPIFGVGPGQFSTFLGYDSGTWKSTHNSFTQVSSEMGIPSFIFFLLAIAAAVRTTWRARKRCRTEKLEPLGTVAVVILTSMVGFSLAALFLNLAYTQYFPLFTGLAVQLDLASRQLLNPDRLRP